MKMTVNEIVGHLRQLFNYCSSQWYFADADVIVIKVDKTSLSALEQAIQFMDNTQLTSIKQFTDYAELIVPTLCQNNDLTELNHWQSVCEYIDGAIRERKRFLSLQSEAKAWD